MQPAGINNLWYRDGVLSTPPLNSLHEDEARAVIDTLNLPDPCGGQAGQHSRSRQGRTRREAAAAAAAASAVPGGSGAVAGGAKKAGAKKRKHKGSFAENFKVLKSSAKIQNLALLVMGYGVAHRLFEFAWKGQLRVLHPTVQGYQSALADVSTYTGILTLASMVVSRLVFQHLSTWAGASPRR